MPALSLKNSDAARVRGRLLEQSMQVLSKKGLQLSRTGKPSKKSRNSTTVIAANGEVQTSEEAQVCVHVLELFVTVQLLDGTPAVLSLGKLCEYEWASGQKPRLTKNGKRILCETEEFVPAIVPGSSSSSSSTSFPQDSSSTSPSPARL